MNKIAKATEEVLKTVYIYFELLFALNGVMLIIIFLSLAMSEKEILYRDIHLRDSIACFGFGLSTSITSVTFKRISNVYEKEISTEYNNKQREEKLKNFVFFGIITILFGVFSIILFSTGCFYYEDFFSKIG